MEHKHIYKTGAFLLFVLMTAYIFLERELFFRVLVGMGFGYAMVRASMGFAGSVNRLSRTGSSTLASALMLMFAFTALVSAFIIYGNESSFKLNIYPINMALVLGGLLFGFGMTFSSCCATGSLTDLASGFSRALVTLFFLGVGVFIGFRFQGSDFVRHSFLSSERGRLFHDGVFLPDWFRFDGFDGYLGAMLMTLFLSAFLIYLAKQYEKNYFKKYPKPTEPSSNEEGTSLVERLLVKPWKMRVSVIIIALLFGALLLMYEKGWSASSAFGLWFGKVLMLFGVDASTLASFTTRSAEFFSRPLWEHGTSVQNVSIILGAVLYVMFAGVFSQKFRAGLKISLKDFFIFAFGGLLMGFGTRLSNGCNVGALYTPIAEFSLSGWIYLVAVVSGGLFGNWVVKNYITQSCAVKS